MSGKRIALISDSRASHSLYIPVLDAITESPDFEYEYVVTGMHLSDRFGHTRDEIEEQGYEVTHTFELPLEEDTRANQARQVGKCVENLVRIFQADEPDIVLAQGDRGCTLAAAIAGSHMRIPVAHMFGGEVSGTIDESVRHAITKLSHLHFVATKESGQRVRRMGEDDFRVHVVGTTGIERIEKLGVGAQDVAAKYGLPTDEPFVVVAQHPVSGEVSESGEQMRNTLDAVRDAGVQALVVYPNSDPGNQQMIDVIEEYGREHGDVLAVQENIPRPEYISILKSTSCLLGNSSAGVVEAPSLGLPVVNVGTRQGGREKAPNVIDTGHGTEEIADSLERALHDEDFRTLAARGENPYDPHGDGEVSIRILDVLADVEPTRRLLEKKIAY